MNSGRPLLYNPDQKGKEQLIDEFVIRQKEFMMILGGLLSSAIQTSPQHYLIVGQRGMGKTTLLLRVKYAIEDNPELNKWLVPIKFSEEQYQIATLDRLWEEIAEHLELADPAFDGLFGEMEKHEDKKDYERIALDILIKAIKKQRKRVVVMIDNLGDLFRKLGDKGNHRLREVLLTHTSLQLIGASADMLEHTFNYDKPFFEFFQQITLQPINKENSFKLLENLGSQYGQGEAVGKLILENPGKIEVLRRLTGGVPRTIALLFSIFIDHQKGSTFEDLLLLLDQVNSFYKHRMDDLKPQQQRIIDALAKAWDPISTKEILKRSKLSREGIESNQISAQLSVLVDNQVVEAVSGKGKLKNYRVRERFFNIWYLMRYGKRQHKEEVLWLVRFLESWCSRKELEDQAEDQINALKQTGYSPQAAYFRTMALYHVRGINIPQKLQLLEQTESYFLSIEDGANAGNIRKLKNQEFENYIDDLIKKGAENKKIERKDLPQLNENSTLYLINSIADKLVEGKKLQYNLTELFEIGVELNDSASMGWMGIAYRYSNPDKAERYFLSAIELGNTTAMLNIAVYYQDQDNIELAEKYYKLAIENGDNRGLNNLGLLYLNEIKDLNLSEKYFKLAVNTGDTNAMKNLANFYSDVDEFKNIPLAEKYFKLAIKAGDTNAIGMLALLYNDRQDFKSAKKYYKMAVNKGNVKSMFNLACFYTFDEKNIELAEKYYKMAIDNGHVGAMFNLGKLYKKGNLNIELAEKYLLMAVENKSVSAGNELAIIYNNERKNLELAEKYFIQSHEVGNIVASENLLRFYAFNKKTEQLISLAEKLFTDVEVLGNVDVFAEIIKILLVAKQYNFLLQQFQKQDGQLIKYARPMYYVLTWFMRDELPGEYEKVSPEVKETVDEIIQKVVAEQEKRERLGMRKSEN